MRYEDASQTDSLSNELPVARDDADALAAGARGPATGNVISGEGTQTGSIGADVLTTGAQITAVDGAGGSDSDFAGGKLNVTGEFGKLSIDAQGNYSYLANAGAPETARDYFTYRLTDAAGNSDSARLMIEIGKTQAQTATQQVVVGPDGVVVLPAGVTLNDIRVVGRDLVVTLLDGSQMVIKDGAVFVPQLVLDNVEIPATNLAALLIDSEPRPAAGGQPPSSGGNFEVPVGPLDPGVPLGDLIPPTELDYTPPDFIDVGVDIENQAPFASNDEINVSDEGLTAGLTDTAGTPDTTDSATATGSISAGDDDGDDLTITLGIPTAALESHDVAIVWALSAGGTVLTGSAGGTTVIVVTMQANGDYTVVQSRPIDHPNGAIEDGVSFVIPVNVSDGEEFADVAITVTIEDDSPRVSNVGVGSSVLLDETDGANPLSSGAPIVATSANAMVAATVAYGADGIGTAPVYGLSLLGGVNSLVSNVQTAVGDFPITLTLTSSTLITATYQSGGTQTAFTITMNANGTVTVRQFTALEHLVDGPPGPAHDDALTLNSAALGNLVNATVTFRDFDGDSAVATAAIGGAITFEDDGPSINVIETIPTDQEGPSPLLLLTGDDGTEGAGSTSDSTTANFAGVFSLVSDGGGDGAAGTPAIVYSLGLLVAGGADSNLNSNGQSIFLYNVGGVVVGSTSAVAPATATDASVVFALSVNGAGVVTLTQYQQIDHPLQAAPNAAPFADQIAVLGSGFVEVIASATITDNDGDTASDVERVDFGNFVQFADDGPAIDAALVAGARIRIDETDGVVAAGGEVDPAGGNLGTVTMGLGTLFTVANTSVSADAPTLYTYALTLGAAVEGLVDSGLQLSTTDAPIYLYLVGTTVVGSTALVAPASLADPSIAFTVSVNAAGDVTLTQFLAVEHPTPGPEGPAHDEDSSGLLAGALNLSVTATDFDGDTATDSVDLGSVIRFEDDGPSVDVTANLVLEPTIRLTTGDVGTEGDGSTSDSTASGNFGGVFGLTFTTGSDGAATPSLTFTLGTPGGASGLFSHGVAINLYNVGGIIVGSTLGVAPATATAASVVFAVSVNASGVVTLTQYQQIDHPLEAAPNAAPFADQLISMLNDASVTLTASSTITDNDEDTDSDSETVNIGANLRFADDGPVINQGPTINSSVTLDETTAGSPDGFPIDMESAQPIIVADVDYGADGQGPAPVYGLSLFSATNPNVVTSLASGLATADGDRPITLNLTSATLITGTYNDGADIAFTIQMNPGGTVTVTQFVALEHLTDGPAGPAHDDSLDLNNALGERINATVTYQDFDGDTATATVGIGNAIIFKDDGPDAEVNGTASLDTIILDESRNEGTDTPGGTLPNGIASATAEFADNFAAVTDYGADGEGSTSYSLLLSLNGIASGLFALEPGDKIVDGDGYGQGASITLSQNATTGVITGSAGGTNYFTLSIDSVTGVVTFTQINPIWHPTPGNSFDEAAVLNTALAANVQVVQTVTDADGDTDTASINVGRGVFSIQDDGPSATTEAQQNVAEGGTVNGTFDFDAGVDGGGVTHVNGTALIFGMDGFSQSILVDDGSIKVKADGTYQFTASNPGSGVTSGNFTVTDGDGDTITATWSFNITDVNSPTAGISAARLDDDGLVGSPDGVLEAGNGDINANEIPPEVAPINTSEAIFHGQLTLSFGGDGPGSVTFAAMHLQPGTVGTENVIYTYVSVGGTGTLTATIDGGVRDDDPLFTLVLNEATGEYTLTLNDNVLHAAGGNEASAPLVPLTYTVTDSDNSPAGGVSGTLNITFNDDTPEIDRNTVPVPILVTDDTDTPNDVAGPVSFATLFTSSFGADGFKDSDDNDVEDANAIAFSLSITGGNGTASGLVDVLTGDAILLRVNAVTGDIEGYLAGAPATIAFIIDLNADTGAISLEQDRAITHNDPLDAIETGASAATMAAGLIVLNGTITDGDGDTDTASANIGAAFQFEDDGPSIDRNATAVPILVTDDTDTPNDVAGPVSFASLFTSSFGKDGFKDSDDNDVEDANAIAFSLSITGGNGTASGLVDVLTGDAILLRVNAVTGDIEGYLAGAPATIAFIIDLNADTGAISLEQDRAITHNDPLDAIETGASAATMAAGLIVLNGTITDGDGDTDTASANIGAAFQFEDDGPSIDRNATAVPILVTDDTDTPNDVAGPVSFASLFTSSFGKDGFKDSDDNDVEDANAIAFSLSITGGNGTASGLVDVLTGDAILLRVNAVTGDIEGYLAGAPATIAFIIDLNADTGAISLEQDRAITHNDPLDAIETGASAATMAAGLIVLNGTITDGDGDTDTASANIGAAFQFEDDGPSIDRNATAVPILVTDDTDTPNDVAGPVSFASLFTSSFGKDGFKDSDDNDVEDANAIAFSLSITGGNGTASGLVDVLTGDAILLRVNAVTGDIEGYLAGAPATIAFIIDLNADTGAISLEQDRAITHNDPLDAIETGASAATMAAGLIVLNGTITDGDGDTDTASANIGAAFQFEDDGPSIDRNATAVPILVTDDTDTPNDVAGPVSFASLFTSSFGKDGFKDSDDNDVEDANAIAFSLSITGGNGTASGLVDVLTGDAILLRVNAVTGDIEGYLAGAPATIAFIIDLNADTGAISLEQDRAITHNDPLDAIETGASAATMAAGLIVLNGTITDGDGDTDTASANIGAAFQFEDDGPSITAVENEITIENDATPSGFGDFAYDIGADVNADFDDISLSNFKVSVNGVLITDPADFNLTPGAETAAAANYTFSFDYDTGTGGIATATGTLVFHKTGPNAGNYEVTLTNGPIEGFTILDTGGASASAFVEHSPQVTTASLAPDFHVQFTGVTGPNSTVDYGLDTTPPSDGLPGTFSNGELLNATTGTVQVSSAAAGVGGNTIQGNQGEVLDFNLYATNPLGVTGGVPTASSTSMFLTFDTVAAGVEDMIIVLKLFNPDTNEYTTRAVVVSNTDLITGPRNNVANDPETSPPLPAPYQNIVLDNNDGFLVIESNDYNGVGENYVIVGAQIAAGDSGIVGTGINFNPTVGAGGASVGTQAFSTDAHDGPFKITSVGFLTESSEDQNATLEFDVTVTDADGDSVTESITVNIGDPPAVTLALPKMSSQEPANDTSSMNLMSFESEEQHQKSAANNNSGVVAAAVAAAGLASTQAAADTGGGKVKSNSFEEGQSQSAKLISNDNDVAADSSPSLMGNDSSVATGDGEQASSPASFDAQSTAQLDEASSAQAAPTELLAGTEAADANSAAASMVAPMIVMPSVEALESMGGNDDAGQHNAVVGNVIAEALAGGGGGDQIDAILAGLGGGGDSGNAALEALASQDGGAVPVWDMGNGGSFQADVLVKVVAETMALHHDAVQPAING